MTNDREVRVALLLEGKVLPLTALESDLLLGAVLARLRRVGRILDDGGVPEDDEKDHRLRNEAGALARIVHVIRVADFPERDTGLVARWRRRMAAHLQSAIGRRASSEVDRVTIEIRREVRTPGGSE
jgi:hypothetical protein